MGCHETHCCVFHGCKYCDDDCPVVTGNTEQKYSCEDCYREGWDGIPPKSLDEKLVNRWIMNWDNCRDNSDQKILAEEIITKYGLGMAIYFAGRLGSCIGIGSAYRFGQMCEEIKAKEKS